MHDRRTWVKNSAAGLLIGACGFRFPTYQSKSYQDLDKILSERILDKSLFPDPVIVSNIDLLELENSYLCKVTTKDGRIGWSSSNFQMQYFYPIFLKRVMPFFEGKDLRDWEDLLEEIYVYRSNYKVQNLALWVPIATLEFAVLDLLGKIANKSIGQLIGNGKLYNKEIAIYQANNFRGLSAEESIERIKKQVAESHAKAVKFKVGGRMSKNLDDPPGRSEKLIPLVRKTFGDDMTIYADSNGSYDVVEAVRIGKLMQEYNFDFYEEPVPFDWYEETKAVNDQLNIPIAGGEQEPSMHNFRWLIHHKALDIVQPDIFYFGGMIRSMKVARMAEARQITCTPHISGSDLGYLYMMQFVSAITNAGPFHEFKGFSKNLSFNCPTSDLLSHGGKITVPTGPGLGIELDQDLVARYRPVVM